MNKWMKLAIMGAVTTVALDYFIKPTLTKNL